MPLLRIEGLSQKPKTEIQRALKKTCAAIAKAYGCEPSNVWATWVPIEHYVEGDNAAATQPDSTHPPIANLVCFEGQTPEQIANLLDVGSKTLAQELDIPGNMFMTYTEMKAGEVFTNGKIRYKK